MLLLGGLAQAQHLNTMDILVDTDTKIISVKQEIAYFNQSSDTLYSIVLNDWNNAYSSKDTPLARHFTDQFIKAFHLARDYDRGNTNIEAISDSNGQLNWSRPENQPDIVTVKLRLPIYPGQKVSLSVNYSVKLPNERFTKFGFDDKTGSFTLRDWYLTPARYENHAFTAYSNENIDDIANAASNYNITITVPKGLSLTADLVTTNKTDTKNTSIYTLSGEGRMGFNMVLEPKNSFEIFNFSAAEVISNLKDNRVSDIQRAALVDNIMSFTEKHLSPYPHKKIMVTQADYDRNPVYGLNQLPSFLRPFPDTFIFEMRFLKTYLNAYLKNTLKLDPRKDNWIYDAIQMQLIMKYAEENHADKKMMGDLNTWKILSGYNLFNVSLNEQYSYLYLLMARRNQDQAIGSPKSSFIKFNEQIAGKYKAGLSINYLDKYLEKNIVPQAIAEFYKLNLTQQQTGRDDFENILKIKTKKDIDWFFDDLVATRKLIDYKFGDVDKKGDSLKITVKNVTGTKAPISLYGLKNNNVLYKQWLPGFATDTTFTIAKGDAQKLALNYREEVPEFNRRNNFKKLNGFLPNNKPFKFTLFQDLEDSDYNQVFYVPSFIYNLYDGFSPGLRFHNKSLLEKPFIFDFEPTYSMNTGELIGSFSLMYNHYIRDEDELYNIRYLITGSTFHYAPDARYTKFTPTIQFRFRDPDLRKNRKEFVTFRQVTVNREKSRYIMTDEQNENYSVFNVRYTKADSEITKHYNYNTDLQLANVFGKLSGEVQYRRLFNDNRQVNIRFFAGMFLYRDTASEFFSFGLDRPSDYLFDYGYYGRSETSGLFSRQFIMADGGFKSQLDTRFANQWMTTVNGSFNVWNWIELYGDAGLFKNKHKSPEFGWDSGVRLNLVTDYFELYFPVYSSNGFELSQPQYSQKIRFVVAISTSTLLNLFTRKWF